jgi:hypothetical protein
MKWIVQLAAAVLTLMACPLFAVGQGTVQNVMATCGAPSPAWTGWGQPTEIAVHATATAPTPDTGSTLQVPNWHWTVQKVEYSNDNISFTEGGVSSTQFTNGTTADDTLKAWFYQGAYWRITCKVTVGYSETPGTATWTGTATCTSLPNCGELVSVTVTSGATQTNVLQVNDYPNWAAVLQYLGTVNIKATVKPNDVNAANLIQWTNGAAVAGDNTQRTVDKGTSARTEVTAVVGGAPAQGVNIWIIWATVTIQLTDTDKVAQDDNSSLFTDNGGNWPDALGGGTGLGPIDHDAVPGLTYAYTVGKMQATGKLTPPGIGTVISTTAWKLNRTREDIAWDNGGHYSFGIWVMGPSSQDPAGKNDITAEGAASQDWDPTSGGSVDTIYDVDAPGCSVMLGGTEINHTSESYVNFTQWITVTLDAETICSDNALWSYQAQVDGDKAVGSRIDLNQLSTGSINIPAGPHYTKR